MDLINFKKRKVAPPPSEEKKEDTSKFVKRSGKPVFFQDPTQHDEYHALMANLRSVEGLLDRCCLDSAFRVPTKDVPVTFLNKLKRVLTTRPKLKYNPVNGRMESSPWKMYHLDTPGYISIPRRVGVELFGSSPPNINVSHAKPLVLLDEVCNLCLVAPMHLDNVYANVIIASANKETTVSTAIPDMQLPLLDKEAATKMFKVDQQTAVACTINSLNVMKKEYGFGSGVFCIPTGNGKTCCAWAIIAHYKMRTLFVLPNIKLMPQFVEEAKKFLGPHVVVETMHTSTKAKRKAEKNMGVHIVLTTFASAATIAYDMSGFGMVVVDEAHETMTPSNFQMYLKFQASIVLVLTATPERADGCGCYLEWGAGDLSFYEEVDLAESQWGGVDVRIVPIQYPKTAPVKERYKVFSDGRRSVDMEALTQQIMHRKDRNEAFCGVIAQMVREEKHHILIVCTRIAHLETMHGMLVRAGIDAGIMIGEHTDGTPPTKEEDEHAFKCRVLLAQIRMAHRALNIPRLSCVGFLSGGAWSDITFWTQLVGRVFRSVPGKQRPVVVLFSDITTDGKLQKQIDKARTTIQKLSTAKGAVQEHFFPPIVL